MHKNTEVSLPRKQQLEPLRFSLKSRDVQKIVNAAPTFRDPCLIRLRAGMQSLGVDRIVARAAELAGVKHPDLDTSRSTRTSSGTRSHTS